MEKRMRKRKANLQQITGTVYKTLSSYVCIQRKPFKNYTGCYRYGENLSKKTSVYNCVWGAVLIQCVITIIEQLLYFSLQVLSNENQEVVYTYSQMMRPCKWARNF